jgi:predicted acyltransferase
METQVQPASRRLLNGTYCAFVLGVNLLVLAGEVWMQRVIMRSDASYFAQAVNRNQLALFLFANVLTGVIGYMMQTIYTPNAIALTVMTGYLFTYSFVAWALERFHIQLKCW